MAFPVRLTSFRDSFESPGKKAHNSCAYAGLQYSSIVLEQTRLDLGRPRDQNAADMQTFQWEPAILSGIDITKLGDSCILLSGLGIHGTELAHREILGVVCASLRNWDCGDNYWR